MNSAAADDDLAFYRRSERYTLLDRLGEGAVGRVDRVLDTRLGRVVACKTLRSEVAADPNALRTFVNEARVLGLLDHPAILPVFDTFLTPDGRPAYTMREIDGQSIARMVGMDLESGRARVLPLQRVLKIVAQIAEALAHAHDRGVLHLDLKPQNIIAFAHDEIVLVDWGSARVYAAERYAQKIEKRPELAEFLGVVSEDESLLIGSPRYMSPEQTVETRASLAPASDIFSLGVVFYQLLTGRLPFHGETLEGLFDAIREHSPASPQEIDPGVPRRLSSIAMRMLEKSTSERYASFEEVVGDLDEFRSTAGEFPSRRFAAGDVIFSEGDPGDAAYVVVEGEVEISTGEGGDRRVLGRNLAGEAFGELALLRNRPRSAAAAALRDTTVRVIEQPALMAEVDKLSPWVLAILSGVVERFASRSNQLVELLRERAHEEASPDEPASEP